MGEFASNVLQGLVKSVEALEMLMESVLEVWVVLSNTNLVLSQSITRLANVLLSREKNAPILSLECLVGLGSLECPVILSSVHNNVKQAPTETRLKMLGFYFLTDQLEEMRIQDHCQ